VAQGRLDERPGAGPGRQPRPEREPAARAAGGQALDRFPQMPRKTVQESLAASPSRSWVATAPGNRPDLLDRQLAICHICLVLDVELVKALANDKRLLILDWLRDPEANFPPQRDGDLVSDGVCSLLIAEKLGVSQPTCGEHLKVLSRAGLIRGTRIKQWVFYQRVEDRITDAKEQLSGDW
jgi:DNA-binding transcriptional ArsR family regulator